MKPFRQGYRRTWVVRALEQPISTKLQHEIGLAVISSVLSCKKRYKIKRSQNGVSFRAEDKLEGDAVFPRIWAAVVAAPAPQKAQEGSERKRSTKTLGTSQPSKIVNLNTTPTAMYLGDIGLTSCPSVSSGSHGGGRPCRAHRSCGGRRDDPTRMHS